MCCHATSFCRCNGFKGVNRLKTLDSELAKKRIAKKIAMEFTAQSEQKDLFINLGVGIPTMIADYIESNRVFLQAENGMLGVGPAACEEEKDCLLINAGRIAITETKGCCYFDSSMSFGMIRGGHIDATVIGAFEVDEKANIANWIIPNGKQLGVGGAMDLVTGAKKVYVAMQHMTKKGTSKIVKECSLPITGFGEVDVVVTEFGLFRFKDGDLYLEEIAPEISLEELIEVTEAKFKVSENLCKMKV